MEEGGNYLLAYSRPDTSGLRGIFSTCKIAEKNRRVNAKNETAQKQPSPAYFAISRLNFCRIGSFKKNGENISRAVRVDHFSAASSRSEKKSQYSQNNY
jgi:hypothetical protein